MSGRSPLSASPVERAPPARGRREVAARTRARHRATTRAPSRRNSSPPDAGDAARAQAARAFLTKEVPAGATAARELVWGVIAVARSDIRRPQASPAFRFAPCGLHGSDRHRGTAYSMRA